jgi:fermentation-respiration switch protein FrsA (DUF1100 family)
MHREDVTFQSGGDRCAAWLYRPSAQEDGPVPCVVLGHGFSGTRELGLDRFAEGFAPKGLAALAFDYRHFGASEGEPRQLVDIKRQLADYAAAIAYARSLEGIDPDRIAVWGSAFSSGHVLVTAARDARIAAVVAQLPYVAPSARALGFINLFLIGVEGAIDEIGRVLGRPPRMIDVVAQPGKRAVLATRDSVSGFRSIIPEGVEWNDRVAARFTLRAPFYRPGRFAKQVACPVLFCVADHDSICPPDLAIQVARTTPRAEVRRYPIGHFAICLGEDFERAVADQGEFLARHLLPRRARGSRFASRRRAQLSGRALRLALESCGRGG